MKKMTAVCIALMIVISCVAAFAQTYTDKATVKAVQQALNDAGYNCGTPDGVAGNKTKNAILAYQKDKGLEESGVIDDALLAAMGLKENTEAPAEATSGAGPAEDIHIILGHLYEGDERILFFEQNDVKIWVNGMTFGENRFVKRKAVVVYLTIENNGDTVWNVEDWWSGSESQSSTYVNGDESVEYSADLVLSSDSSQVDAHSSVDVEYYIWRTADRTPFAEDAVLNSVTFDLRLEKSTDWFDAITTEVVTLSVDGEEDAENLVNSKTIQDESVMVSYSGNNRPVLAEFGGIKLLVNEFAYYRRGPSEIDIICDVENSLDDTVNVKMEDITINGIVFHNAGSTYTYDGETYGASFTPTVTEGHFDILGRGCHGQGPNGNLPLLQNIEAFTFVLVMRDTDGNEIARTDTISYPINK